MSIAIYDFAENILKVTMALIPATLALIVVMTVYVQNRRSNQRLYEMIQTLKAILKAIKDA